MSRTNKSYFSRFFPQSYIGTSAIFVVLSLLSAGVNYAYYPLIAHFLTPSEFGATQALIAILLQVGAIFSGLNLVTIYLVHKLDENAARKSIEILQKITTTLFIAGTLAIIVAQSAVLHFLHIDNHSYLLIVSFDLITSVPFIIAFGFLQARRRFVAAGFLQLLVALTKVVLGVLATKRFGASGALLGIAIGQVFGMLLFWVLCGLLSVPAWEHKILQSLKPPSLANLRFIKPVARNISAIFFINVVLVLFISFDIITARHYFAPSLSGLYSGASTLSNAIVFVCLPLISVLLANLNSTSLRASKKPFFRTTAMVILVMLAASLVLYAIPKPLLSIFGPSYTVMAYLLWRLGILMSLLAGISLVLQVGAFYSPLRTALICLGGLLVLINAVIHNHQSPSLLVSTIMGVFVTILFIGVLQIIWIYSHGTREAA